MSAPSVYAECFAWEAPPGGAAVLEQAVPFQASADVGEAVPTLCGPPGGGVTLRGSACARSRLLTWRASGCCLELSELSLGEQPGFEQQAAADCGLRLCFSAPLLGGALACHTPAGLLLVALSRDGGAHSVAVRSPTADDDSVLAGPLATRVRSTDLAPALLRLDRCAGAKRRSCD